VIKSKEILEKVKEREEGIEKEKMQMLAFSSGKEFYLLDIQYVKEILNMTKITPIPCIEESILGVINLRGDIIPIIDVKKILRLDVSSVPKMERIIILEVKSKSGDTSNEIFGMVVDTVIDIMQIEIDNIQPPILTIEEGRKDWIDGEIEIYGRLFGVLNIKNIITTLI